MRRNRAVVDTQELMAAFCAARGAAPTPHPEPRAELLVELCESAHEALPAIATSAVTFAAYLGERVPPSLDPEEFLARLHCRDLYVACGCAHGDKAALETLETKYLSEVGFALARLDQHSVVADDLQALREWLLMPRGNKPPAITKYSGRGQLVSWLRVTAVRLASRRRRRVGKVEASSSSDAELLEAIAQHGNPELLCLEQHQLSVASQAFNDAVAELSVSDRNLLRHRYLDDLTVQQIGRMYGRHHSNICRGIDRACDTILARTRALLRERLRVGEATVDSILNLVGSRLELALSHRGSDRGGRCG